jgi:hypothetical protein
LGPAESFEYFKIVIGGVVGGIGGIGGTLLLLPTIPDDLMTLFVSGSLNFKTYALLKPELTEL